MVWRGSGPDARVNTNQPVTDYFLLPWLQVAAWHLRTWILVLHLLMLPVEAVDVRYWIWHRTAPLTAEETRNLTEQNVQTLYWHAGTLRTRGESWQLEGTLQLPPMRDTAPSIAPVIRLAAEGAMPLGGAAADSVVRILKEALRRTGAAEAQIDFDCPDRRLSEYAAFLIRCRAQIAPARLSVTALAGWGRSPDFTRLQGSVDALFPMFYDLTPDSAVDVQAGRVLPLVDTTTLQRHMDAWSACRIPWFAGLPNYARVTIFDHAGRSRGHLRAWDWDEVSFNPALLLNTQPAPGVTLLRAVSDSTIAGTPVVKNELIACRLPERAQLTRAIAQAEKAGAAGVAIFRLPGVGSQGGWSLTQLGTLLRGGQPGEPVFKLRRIRQGLELVNVSGSDLSPRLAGAGGRQDRGWQLEVESSAGAVFREVSPGEFANVFGHTDPEAAEPKRVSMPLAERLTYWFGDLRAGKSRQTGLLLLVPGTDSASLRWRIPNSAQNSQWQPVE